MSNKHNIKLPIYGHDASDYDDVEGNEYVAISVTGTYLFIMAASGMGANSSRECAMGAFITTDSSTPTSSSTEISRMAWTNSGMPSGANYITVEQSTIFTETSTATRLKCWGLGQYGDQYVGLGGGAMYSGLTFVRLG